MRAEGVLGLFLRQEALSDEQLDMIFGNCNDEIIYRNLIGSLKNLASNIKPLSLSRIIDRIIITPKNKVKGDEIDLLKNLCYESNSNRKAEDEPLVRLNQCKVLEFYWDFLTEDGADE